MAVCVVFYKLPLQRIRSNDHSLVFLLCDAVHNYLEQALSDSHLHALGPSSHSWATLPWGKARGPCISSNSGAWHSVGTWQMLVE